MIILISIAVFIVVLNIELYLDGRRLKKQKGIKHRSKPLKRFFMLNASIAGFVVAHPWEWYWSLLLVLPMIGFAWWLLFDGLYNVLRKEAWWYNGGHNDPTEPDDGWLDQKLEAITDRQEAWLKIGGTGVLILIYSLTSIL